MDRQFDDSELGSYLDGEMEAEDAASLEAALVDSSALAARFGMMAAQRAAIVREMARASLPLPATTHALEERLAAALGGRRRRLFGRHAAALVGATLFAAGWAAAHAGDIGALGEETFARLTLPDWAEEAIDAHDSAVGANLDLQQLVATDPARLTAILARGVGHLLPPHLRAHDRALTLIGAQVVPWDGGSALQVLYRTRDGRPVTLFIAAVEGPDEPEPTVAVFGHLTLIYWRSDNYVYALSGEMPAERLLHSAQLLASADSG